MRGKTSAGQIALLAVVVVVLALIANRSLFVREHWQTYSPADGAYSVELPGKPRILTKETPIAGGSGTITSNIAMVETLGSAAYLCSYSEHENIGKKTPEQALNAARDGSMRQVQGTVIEEKRTTIEGYPAMELRASVKGNMTLDSRLVVVGNRMYMLMVVTPQRAPVTEKAARMFASFHLNRTQP